MSYNSHLAFNISKATPTTSTTNTNTVSSPPTSNEVANSGGTGIASPKSPFLHNILSKSAPSAGDVSPQLGSGSTVTPTIVTIGDESSSSTNLNSTVKDSQTSNNKSDLIGLLGKFDISNKKEEAEDAEDDSENNSHNEKLANEEASKQIEDDDENHKEANEGILVEKVDSIEQIESHPANNEVSSEMIEKRPTAKLSTIEATSGSPEIRTKQIEEGDNNVINDRDLTDITGKDEESVAEEYSLHENEPEAPESDKETNSESEVKEDSKPGKSKKNQPIINSEEQYQQSHKPFDFQHFLNHMKKKSADPIVRYIRSFLVSFNRQGHTFTLRQKIKIIRDFKDFMNEKFALYEPFASMDAIDLENSREGLEKLIMNRLYEHCFPPEVAKQGLNFVPESIKDDIQQDEDFLEQLEKFNWINGTHLDIDLDYLTKVKSKTNKDNLNFMDFAITELNKINNYRAPRDKIICILNSCKIIFSFLRVSKRETNADSFIPLLILVIIKAKTDNLISNMHYIENFRNEEWLSHGETSYYLSSLQGAIGFINNLNFDDLTIDENEYQAHMEAWEAEGKQRALQKKPIEMPIPQRKVSGLQEQDPATSKAGLSPSNVLFTSAEMFTKSLSNFLSPSPQDASHAQEHSARPLSQQETRLVPNENHSQEGQQIQENSDAIKETYKSLREVFPNLDKAILKDVVFMNKGNLDESLDSCLQLVNDV